MGELPHLKALVERHPDDFVVFGVNTDDDADEYRAKAVEHGVTWPDVFAGSTDGEIPRRWGVTGENLFLRPRGHFSVWFALGRDPEPLERLLALLRRN